MLALTTYRRGTKPCTVLWYIRGALRLSAPGGTPTTNRTEKLGYTLHVRVSIHSPFKGLPF